MMFAYLITCYTTGMIDASMIYDHFLLGSTFLLLLRMVLYCVRNPPNYYSDLSDFQNFGFGDPDLLGDPDSDDIVLAAHDALRDL